MIPHSDIRSALRKIWCWNTTGKVRSRARVSRGCYQCEKCQRFVSAVEVDHVVPVGPTPGSRNASPETTWDGFIARLFCAPEHLQVLCEKCHDDKTHRRTA